MPADTVVFLSGLPRSGSTLLSNVLAQNPRFEVTPTSPLAEYVISMGQAFSASPQRAAYLNQKLVAKKFRGAVRGAISGHFDAHLGIDKSRAWTGLADLLSRIYGPALRVIVTVRDLRGVVASHETRFRTAPEFRWGVDMLDINSRAQHYLSSVPLGPALRQIREAFRTYHAEGWLFVRMEDFCKNPKKTLHTIYKYIDEPEFEHDLKNIRTTPLEHDGVHAPIGAHTLSASTILPPRENWDTVLGPDLARKIIMQNQWFYRMLYPGLFPASIKTQEI
jgi:sulfotransferase